MKTDGLTKYYVVAMCVLTICGFLSGCGGSMSAGDQAIAANITEITGTVKFKGKPMQAVEVYLVKSDDEKVSSMGITGPDGKFSMSGLPPATYQVRLGRQGANGEPDAKLAPYWEQSPLTAEVSPEKTDFEFDLDI